MKKVVDQAEVARKIDQLLGWCQQTVACAVMVRERERHVAGIEDRDAADTFKYVIEISERIQEKVGPTSRYANATLWMTELSDQTFRWVEKYLERGPKPKGGASSPESPNQSGPS